ncbi:MAG: PfkB family carbohydrate kinase [Prosthecobacter sp.]|nr:PfkB family carbohydrate kinase [Prosthecobacter sp.]
MTTGSFKVIGIGAETWDEFFVVPEFSAQEHVAEAASHAEDKGGPVATALAVLRAHGHECMLIDGEPAHAVILVRQRDGARQIVFMPSSAAEPVFEPKLLEGAHLLHLNGRHENACRDAVRQAQAQNVEISFDGGAGRFRESIRDLFEASHVRIVSRDFAEKCSGSTDLYEMAAKLLQPPTKLLVITEGTSGSQVWTPDGAHFHQPAFKAEPLIDTTGCGDVFHGAFLHGWLLKWPLERCAAHASRLAARNAEGLGGRHALRSMTSNIEP